MSDRLKGRVCVVTGSGQGMGRSSAIAMAREGGKVVVADINEEAVKIAQEFPWIGTGSIEVRPVRDFEAVRRRVGA